MKKRFFRVGIVLLTLFFLLAYAVCSDKNKNPATEMKTDEIASITETSEFVITNTRVEFVKNPVGIDILNPSFSWEIESDVAGMKQKAYRIVVWKEEKSLEEGSESDGEESSSGESNTSEKVVWDSGYMESDKIMNIVYEGEALKSHQKYFYTITCVNEKMEYDVSEKGSFQTAYVGEKPFVNAKMISMQGEENVYDEGQAVFIKEFEVDEEELVKATLYASSLGIYDAYINGERVGEDELKPGWSNYNKTLYYNTYDVTSLLADNHGTDNEEMAEVSEAEDKDLAERNAVTSDTETACTNRIAVMLGTGWWCGRASFGTYDYHKPGFICTIRLEYKDGSVREINTDEGWRYVKDTAVVSADIFNGEVYNANKPSTEELSVSYEQPEITDAVSVNQLKADAVSQGQPETKEVVVSTDFAGEYRSFYGYQVKNIEAYDKNPVQAVIYDSVIDNGSKKGEIAYGGGAPSEIQYEEDAQENLTQELKLKKGETVIFDFGQNMTGVPYVNLSAPEGCEIKIDFAEMLNDSGKTKRGNDGPKGSLYTANYRSAVSDFTIIADGSDIQEYQPVFTYYGFRYMSVTATEDITIHRIKAKFIGNSSEEAGWLVTDHEMVNQLYQNAKWTQRNNYLLVATDCPQRDERIGWMGDLQVFAKTSLYNQDLYSFYKKWSGDVIDSQTAEGAYTDTVPATIITGSGNAGWGDAGISVPLDLYRMYGDKELLEDSYDSMQKYMAYLETVSNFDVESGRIGPLPFYGDWLGIEDSDKEMISTLYYAKDAMQMAQIAEILKDKKGSLEYEALYEKIKDYFTEKYMSDNKIREEFVTQTTLVLALEYGLLDEELKEQATERLKSKISDAGMTLTTGFLGTPVILKALSDNDELATAYDLLLQEKNPSWIYSIRQGATTIWERYDSYTKENGFADVAMNSFNHFNNGSVLAWMYEEMLGIKVDYVQGITLKPGIIPDYDEARIHKVSGGYHSVYGVIESEWEVGEKQVTYQVKLPANSTARLFLPIDEASAKVSEEGKKEKDNMQEFKLESGSYFFIYDSVTGVWEMQ